MYNVALVIMSMTIIMHQIIILYTVIQSTFYVLHFHPLFENSSVRYILIFFWNVNVCFFLTVKLCSPTICPNIAVQILLFNYCIDVGNSIINLGLCVFMFV